MGNETQQKDNKKDEEEDSGIQIKVFAGSSPTGDIADGALSDSEVECHRSSTHIVSDREMGEGRFRAMKGGVGVWNHE